MVDSGIDTEEIGWLIRYDDGTEFKNSPSENKAYIRLTRGNDPEEYRNIGSSTGRIISSDSTKLSFAPVFAGGVIGAWKSPRERIEFDDAKPMQMHLSKDDAAHMLSWDQEYKRDGQGRPVNDGYGKPECADGQWPELYAVSADGTSWVRIEPDSDYEWDTDNDRASVSMKQIIKAMTKARLGGELEDDTYTIRLIKRLREGMRYSSESVTQAISLTSSAGEKEFEAYWKKDEREGGISVNKVLDHVDEKGNNVYRLEENESGNIAVEKYGMRFRKPSGSDIAAFIIRTSTPCYDPNGPGSNFSVIASDENQWLTYDAQDWNYYPSGTVLSCNDFEAAAVDYDGRYYPGTVKAARYGDEFQKAALGTSFVNGEIINPRIINTYFSSCGYRVENGKRIVDAAGASVIFSDSDYRIDLGILSSNEAEPKYSIEPCSIALNAALDQVRSDNSLDVDHGTLEPGSYRIRLALDLPWDEEKDQPRSRVDSAVFDFGYKTETVPPRASEKAVCTISGDSCEISFTGTDPRTIGWIVRSYPMDFKIFKRNDSDTICMPSRHFAGFTVWAVDEHGNLTEECELQGGIAGFENDGDFGTITIMKDYPGQVNLNEAWIDVEYYHDSEVDDHVIKHMDLYEFAEEYDADVILKGIDKSTAGTYDAAVYLKKKDTGEEYPVGHVTVIVKDMAVATVSAQGLSLERSEYIVGQSASLSISSGSVTVSYNDGETIERINASSHRLSLSPSCFTEPGDYVEVTVLLDGQPLKTKGSESDAGTPVTFNVKVIERKLTGLDLTPPSKLDYFTGDTQLQLAGGKISVSWNDGQQEELLLTDEAVNVSSLSGNEKAGEKVITVTFKGESRTFTINLKDPALTSIMISSMPKTEYMEGDCFDPSGGILTLRYENGKEKTVPMSSGNVTITDGQDKPLPSALEYGRHEVWAHYETKKTPFTISADRLEAIVLAAEPAKKEYFVGNTVKDVDLEGGILRLRYGLAGAKDLNLKDIASKVSISASFVT
ncbi:MAG: bacterial Ig-like domain-containing protein, partial [Lachnospiraceae bacterium]|nr:bacterial Ig-like domain-containing protein [Lachnospiraceae bacterium]